MDVPNYVKTTVYMIYSSSMISSLLYTSREKALAKLNELMSKEVSAVYHIDCDYDGTIVEGWDDDAQAVVKGAM